MKNDIPQDLIDQYGFTLIELMISLVLGLLISAAVMQVFLTSQRVDRIQTAGSEIQDKAVFGLQGIEAQVRLANLGNDGITINDTVAMGGIVLTAGDDGGDGDGDGGDDNGNNGNNGKGNNGKGNNGKGNNGNKTAYNFRHQPIPEFQRADFRVSDFQTPVFQRADFKGLGFQRIGFQRVASSSASGPYNVMVKGGLDTGYLTRSNSMTSGGSDNKWNSSLSNTNNPSDQLTIQYINTTGRSLYDCEGSKILEGERVITRYFVADGGGTGNNARKNLDLRCDAGRIKSNGTLEDFTDKGEVIIENIDQFNVRLGVQRTLVNNGALTYQYADMTVADYMALGSGKPAITNIRIAILARSTANSPEASGDDFDIFGVEQTLKNQDNAPKYLRRVYESNILLRNARVMRIIETSIV